MRKIKDNILWNSFGCLFYFGCQWLLTVLVVYFKEGYSDAGVLSLAMSISNVLAVVASLNLRTFQISELDGRFSEGEFIVNRILTSGISLILCVCIVIYKDYSSYEQLCIVVFMIFKLSEALGDVLHGIEQRVWRLDIAGKSFLLRGLATLFSIALGMFLGGSLIVTIAIMAILTYLVIYFYDFKKCKIVCSPNFFCKRGNVVALVKIGIPLALSSIVLSLVSIFPRFQIEEQYGRELLGIFASIATPTVLVTQLASFVFSPLMGVFAECRKGRNEKRMCQILLISFAAIIMIGVVSVAAGSWLGEWGLVLLFGESIRSYAYLLIPIIYTAILTAVIWLLTGLLTVFKDYCMLAILISISFVLSVAITPTLVADKALLGAALALLASLSVGAILLIARIIYLLHKEGLLYR